MISFLLTLYKTKVDASLQVVFVSYRSYLSFNDWKNHSFLVDEEAEVFPEIRADIAQRLHLGDSRDEEKVYGCRLKKTNKHKMTYLMNRYWFLTQPNS